VPHTEKVDLPEASYSLKLSESLAGRMECWTRAVDPASRGTDWTASRQRMRIAPTVVLKLKTGEFKILTRSHTSYSPRASCEELTSIALSLRDRVVLGPRQRFRLLGVGLSNFHDPDNASAQLGLLDWPRTGDEDIYQPFGALQPVWS
jgi:nucleotidyltransferase/DNA polymerase involved in DNA repair